MRSTERQRDVLLSLSRVERVRRMGEGSAGR